MEIVHTAPHLEKVERVVHELFRSHSRGEWSVVNILPGNSPEPRRDRSARKFILQMQFNQWSETEPQPIRVGLRKGVTQHSIEDKPRFEIGSSKRVFDPPDAIPKIEPLGSLFGRREQALQPPPKVRSLADV